MAPGSDGDETVDFATQMKDLLTAKFPSKTEITLTPDQAECFDNSSSMSDSDDIEAFDLNNNDLAARGSKIPDESKFISVGATPVNPSNMLTSSDDDADEDITDTSLSAFAHDHDIYLGRAPPVDSSVTFDHVRQAGYPRDMPFEGNDTSIATSDDWHFNRPTLPRAPAPPVPEPSQSRRVHQKERATTKR